MTRILALSGSLRRGSFNTALARAAARLVPEGVHIDVTTLHGIPLYDGDLEAAEGIPQAVLALKQTILASDGLLLVTPEYNNGIPGVFKNGIDWLSRAGLKQVFGDVPTGLMGASPGGFGTLSAQTAWLPVLRMLGVRLYVGGSLHVARANTLVDAQGEIADAATLEKLGGWLQGFAAFVQANSRLDHSTERGGTA